jgi:hypothetical protein
MDSREPKEAGDEMVGQVPVWGLVVDQKEEDRKDCLEVVERGSLHREEDEVGQPEGLQEDHQGEDRQEEDRHHGGDRHQVVGEDQKDLRDHRDSRQNPD